MSEPRLDENGPSGWSDEPELGGTYYFPLPVLRHLSQQIMGTLTQARDAKGHFPEGKIVMPNDPDALVAVQKALSMLLHAEVCVLRDHKSTKRSPWGDPLIGRRR